MVEVSLLCALSMATFEQLRGERTTRTVAEVAQLLIYWRARKMFTVRMLRDGTVQHKLRAKGEQVDNLREHEAAGLVAAGFAEMVTEVEKETATATPAETADATPTGRGRSRAARREA